MPCPSLCTASAAHMALSPCLALHCIVLQATRRGVWVSNILSAGTGNALSCAEHAIYLMLATLRDQNSMAASIQRQQLGVPLGQTLYGKTVLIVGFGNIAKELIPRWAAPCCTQCWLQRCALCTVQKGAAPLPHEVGCSTPSADPAPLPTRSAIVWPALLCCTALAAAFCTRH